MLSLSKHGVGFFSNLLITGSKVRKYDRTHR
ncbi:MAG: hypothetical protein H6Q33_3368 [Deltaproteobacteria bacterium]|nr:hypothetical protein [Deltaproteobacteria bacterium]